MNLDYKGGGEWVEINFLLGNQVTILFAFEQKFPSEHPLQTFWW